MALEKSKSTVIDVFFVDINMPFLNGLDFIKELKKLYPEGPCEARFRIRAVRKIYAFCNRHGLFLLKT